MQDEQNDKAGKIRKVLISEIGLLITIILMTISAILFIVVPSFEAKTERELIKQSINVIETNHLVHIQLALDNNNTEHKGIQVQLNEVNLKLERILTILK